MNYIVFDLEWNQSNTGKEEETEKLPFEIIEIGAVKLNSEREEVSRYHQLIKPSVYHEMHQITQKLIHLQMDELEKGIAFPKAVAEFLQWCGEDYIFCSWGPLDLLELQRNMKYYGMEPITDRPMAFYDIQKLFSIAYEDRKSRRSLEYAIDFLNIEKDIPFHRAISDAYYTAKVMASFDSEKIFSNFSYDTYVLPDSKEKEIFTVFDNYAKYISREFEDKTEITNDKQIMSSKCHLCHKNLKKKVRWFTPNGKHYYCVANCDKHGLMKFKVRIKKSENNKLYVVKTMKYISQEEADKLKLKKERTKEIKKIKKEQKTKNKDSDD
ncbi:MAG: exonuclease domain-containing protein [Lachnospiraceae bacterium]|nr:exonuclease domain-containing protein [Lachnospiraceae bacterium]